MTHPYRDFPPKAFWKTAVTEADRDSFPDLYIASFAIGQQTRVATAGSCFAQHITRYLRLARVPVIDAEPAPRAMPEGLRHRFGYDLFSGRYGNIYTARQMRELLDEVTDGKPDPRLVWDHPGGFADALRPTVEPEGLASPEEVHLMRRYHLARVAAMLRQTDVFVFTLGLAEAWIDTATGRTLPLCPGVAAGTYDPMACHLHVFRHAEVLTDLAAILALLQQFNPDIRLLLTVSPVPLTATATGRHVLDATSAAKATLRSAVAEFIDQEPGAAYFPSFEIVTHPASGGPWFEADLRSVSAAGIDKVMGIFLAAHGLLDGPPVSETPNDAGPFDANEPDSEDDLVCDELLLQAFAP